MIRRLDITRYQEDGWTHTTETVIDPTWERVLRELTSMDNFRKPIVWMAKDPDRTESEVMAINGGSGVFHIQIEEADDWFEAYDPSGSSDEIEVWKSDQGFSTEIRKTWDLENTLEIVAHYFQTGMRSPTHAWTNQ